VVVEVVAAVVTTTVAAMIVDTVVATEETVIATTATAADTEAEGMLLETEATVEAVMVEAMEVLLRPQQPTMALELPVLLPRLTTLKHMPSTTNRTDRTHTPHTEATRPIHGCITPTTSSNSKAVSQAQTSRLLPTTTALLRHLQVSSALIISSET
jgi:hypothetical protein